YKFICTQTCPPEHLEREAEGLRSRMKEIEQGLLCACPSRYGKDRVKQDRERLQELERVRLSGLKLSKHEDIEEAWLTARLASWDQVPEWAARARLSELDERRWDNSGVFGRPLRFPDRAEFGNPGPPLTLRERAEFRALQTTYADHENDWITLIGQHARQLRQ